MWQQARVSTWRRSEAHDSRFFSRHSNPPRSAFDGPSRLTRGEGSTLRAFGPGHVPGTVERVLVVDDDDALLRAMERLLRAQGFQVMCAADGAAALDLVARGSPDLIVLDVLLPGGDGCEICASIKSGPETRLIPVIMLTGLGSLEDRVRGIDAGADSFITKPFEAAELTARVRSLLRTKRYTDRLETAESVLLSLGKTVERRDAETNGHCERLALYAHRLATELELSEAESEALQWAGYVHDIGKVGVPDAILLKRGPLTEEERCVMEQHPVIGEEICRGLKSFRSVLPIIRHHHERMDGSGYPDGLRGYDIPVSARVLQVVDVYDALTSNRPYRTALSAGHALSLMADEVGRGWWDPDVFALFSRLVHDPHGPHPTAGGADRC